ncbi:hypothetical protein LXA47_19225 [Massilia sp. P8910]|uniref:hypothetical protein n=1 Tax=Massilia antarctica TaxID=2765360 RepID=UPI001E62DD34|nr:hypothetical protein [Massilia antarctica]MCE3605720.1 hypothetical protein [Massilia antarctica]
MRVGFVKKCFMAFMCCLMLVQQQHSFAQAQVVAPVANFVVNRAIAGSIVRVAMARGFAANDPRIAATLLGVGSSMTVVNVVATVGGVALAVAGAPVWLTVVGGLGIMAVGAAIIAGTTELKVDGGVVTVSNGAPALPAYVPPPTNFLPSNDTDYVTIAQLIADGSKLYRSPETSGSICTAGSGKPCTTLQLQSFSTTNFRREILCSNGGSKAYCANGGVGIVIAYSSLADFAAHYFDGAVWTGPGGGGQYIRNKKSFATDPALAVSWNTNGTGSITGKVITLQECKQSSPTGANCPGYPMTVTENFFSSNESPSLRVLKYGPPAPQQFASLDAAVAGLDATSKAAKISSDTLSKMVNKAWQNAAAQPGYTGLPYSVTEPVTPAEVQAWQFENPALNPTINDLLVPAVAPGGNIQISVGASATPTPTPTPTPDPTPTPTPVGSTNVNVVNVPTVRVEWGADPGVAAPSLEQTPTASAILSPLLNLMPSLRSFVVPSHSSVCPTATMSLFQKQLVMQSHCAVLDESKPVLYAMMAFVWLMLATFIVLRA